MSLTNSKLHYSWTVVSASSHVGEARRWAELLALGSGALLLERKNVSLSPELRLPAGHTCEEFILDQGAPLGEWCSSFCFFSPLVYALILIF